MVLYLDAVVWDNEICFWYQPAVRILMYACHGRMEKKGEYWGGGFVAIAAATMDAWTNVHENHVFMFGVGTKIKIWSGLMCV